MRTLKFCVVLLFAFIYGQLQAQTANDYVPPYDGHFRFGMNQGYFPPWNDRQLAEIAAGVPEKGIPGVGVKALRPALPEWLMEIYGYDFRKSTYEYYETLGMTDHTVIVEQPADWHRDLFNYCGDGNDNNLSRMFANLYSPIWDNGENGTPVNDTNYLALYLYKTASIYKDHIKFYEIWNEPDFFLYGNIWNYADPNNTWWVRNPNPCEYQLRAPIFHYIRTLRVSYEVIKFVDPDAYVSIGALGMPHFLDAVLRNTDNPYGGGETEEFPLKGGAYFDVMGYHEYPHIDGSLWDYDYRTQQPPNNFLRNSDNAVESGIYRKKDEFQAVLDKHGYDGSTYPEKLWIITESNMPRQQFTDTIRYYGSDELQRNYIIKAAIGAMKQDVLQFHPFTLGDQATEEEATYEFQLMGMYKKLRDTDVYAQEVNNVGIAYKTVSDMLFETRYDAEMTTAMQLPDGVAGGAFRHDDGSYTFALWAKTLLDKSEVASATYSFPNDFGIETLEGFPWNYGYEVDTKFSTAAQNIPLTGAPLFFRAQSEHTSCDCPDTFRPVCGEDGNTYRNGCWAECEGVAYTDRNCNQLIDGVDLEVVSLTSTPSAFRVFSPVVFELTIRNNGTEAANNVQLHFPIPKGELAYVNAEVSQGNFRVAAQIWEIGTVAAGAEVTLSFTLFTLVRRPIDVFAQIIQMEQEDLDSSPNNGDYLTAQEDDEVQLTISYAPPTVFNTQNQHPFLQINPNPVHDQLIVYLGEDVENTDIKIVSMQGQLIQQTVQESGRQFTIDVADLPSGSYHLILQNVHGISQQRFIKQ
ncbi:MAG: T9SS type A sorting domain-containing protein [Bacteroidota bacterium]